MERKKSIGAQAAMGSEPVAENSCHQNKKSAFLVRSGKARHNKHAPYRGKNPYDLKISSKDAAGQLSVFEYIGIEKIGPPLHVHLEQDEVFYVVEGEYRFQLGEERHELKPGDTIFFRGTSPTPGFKPRIRGNCFTSFSQP